MIILSATNNINYSAIRNSLSSVSFTDNNTLEQDSISSVPFDTNILASFSVSTSSVLTFTIASTEPLIVLRIRIYPQNSCSTIIDTTCSTNSYPCTFVSPNSLDAQDYYLVITDSINFATSTTYNITASFVYGNPSCRNITNDLQFCAGHLDPNQKYDIPVANVANPYETDATTAYNTLIGTWDVACNMSVKDYACKSVFQPALCTATGDTTTVYLCKNDCVSTLESACTTVAGTANLCETTACASAASLVNQCNRPPPTPPPSPGSGGSGSTTLHFMFFLSLLSLLMLLL